MKKWISYQLWVFQLWLGLKLRALRKWRRANRHRVQPLQPACNARFIEQWSERMQRKAKEREREQR
jgi:hypothetical protein